MRPARLRLLAAVLALCAPLGAAALEFGTLFHSPQERERLDRLRRGEVPGPAAAAASSAGAALTGYVQRSDGRNTLWIDGLAVPVAGGRAESLLDPRKVQGPSPGLVVPAPAEREAPPASRKPG